MGKYLIITDKKLPLPEDPQVTIVSPSEYIRNTYTLAPSARKKDKVKIINLCSDYEYMSMGYYCTLMAEARGHRVIPALTTLLDLNWKRLYQRSLPEINELLVKQFKPDTEDFSAYKFQIFFGRCDNAKLQQVARRIFDNFRCPILEVELRCKNNWEVVSIEPLSVSALTPPQLEHFGTALSMFTGTAWQNPKVQKAKKYWIAILHSPTEKMPPSDPVALKKFIKAGEDLGAEVELIEKDDFSDLLEYDALFIRETTQVDHHTFRFAKRAEVEGIPCIDSTASIMRCANKVFLKELLETHKIDTPSSIVIDRKNIGNLSKNMTYPCVLKIPDGSFSRGVMKVNTEEEFVKKAKELLNKSDVIMAQEFLPSDFDWRVGVLNHKPLFVSKYYMAKGHWQVYNHAKKGKDNFGKSESLRIEDAPPKVVETALKAASLIGDGLYGVDLKQIGDRVVVIEVNDNPNIDSGCEDTVLGMEIYKTILADLIQRIESR